MTKDSRTASLEIEAPIPHNMMDFLDRFGTDEACLEYIRSVRWPNGFICPACGSGGGWVTARNTVYCKVCQHQTSLTAGTILHNTRTPVRKWFTGVWLLCTQKTGVSAKTLQRELDVRYKTAWLILQKLRDAMVRVNRSRLSKKVEVDETYIGGEETGVLGRQLVGKSLVVIAVELDGKTVGRVRLRHIPDASGKSLIGFLDDCVEKGSQVHTDDWTGYNGVEAAGYVHRVTPILGDKERALKYFPHVHLVASLLKRWLCATHQGGVQAKHLQGYLDEFSFRFNRRRSRHAGKIFYRLLEQLVSRKARTYKQIVKGAENQLE